MNCGCRLQAAGCRLQATGYRLQAAGCRLQAAGKLLTGINTKNGKCDEHENYGENCPVCG
jgi:hypothetical protein